ncbi:MAG: FKBP-type peptidyl-prolyl cis-trans isomerase, partial [Mycoplasmoidaceae bacterium]|nr:FKBP-type peptidyl-prolyl cis-trans isomerase [Mycoplasmoidaceae bacterium]
MLADKESQVIANGDMANIDFEGFIENKPFPGGKAKGYDLEIGSKSFIPGFEEQLIGLKKGDKKDIKVTFPKDYFEKSLAGKETKFAIVVN